MRPTVKPIGCYPFGPEVVHVSGFQLRGLLVEGDASSPTTSSGDRCPLDRFVASTRFGNSGDERDWGELVEVRVKSTIDRRLSHYDTGPWVVRLHQGLSQLYAVDNPERGLDDNSNEGDHYLPSLIRTPSSSSPPHIHSIPPFLCQSVELPLAGYLTSSLSSTSVAEERGSNAVSIYRRRLGSSLHTFRELTDVNDLRGAVMSRPSFENLLLCILAYIDVCHDLPHLDGIDAGVLYHDLFAHEGGLNHRNTTTATSDGGECDDGDGSTTNGATWSLRMPPPIIPSREECGIKWVISGNFSPVPPEDLEVLRQQGQEEYAQTLLEAFLDMLMDRISSHTLHVFDFLGDNAVTVTKSRTLPVQKNPLLFLSRAQLSHLTEEVLLGRLRLQRTIQPPANDPPADEEDGEYNDDDGGSNCVRRGTTFTVLSQRAKIRGLYKKPPPKPTAREQADLDRMRDRTSRLENVSPASSSHGSCESLHDLLASPLCTHTPLLCDCPDCQKDKDIPEKGHYQPPVESTSSTSVKLAAPASRPIAASTKASPPPSAAVIPRQQLAGTQHHRFAAYLRDGEGGRASDVDTPDDEEEEPVFRSSSGSAHPTISPSTSGADVLLPPQPVTASSKGKGDKAYRCFISQINTITEESAKRAASSREPPHRIDGGELVGGPVAVNVNPPPTTTGSGCSQMHGSSQPSLAPPPSGPPTADGGGAPRQTSLTKNAPPPAPPGKKGVPRSGLYRKEMAAWEKEKEAREIKQGQCCIVM